MLPKHRIYYYTQKRVFGDEPDSVHAFVMPGYNIGMHVQEFHEINIVIRGKGMHYIEENCLEATVGDIFIIPPEVRHGYVGAPDFDVFHVLIHRRFIEKHSFDFQSLESYFDLFSAEPIMRTKSKKPLYLKLSDERFEKVRALLSQMEEYPDTALASDCLARNGLTTVLISMLCKAYSESENSVDTGGGLHRADECFMKAISSAATASAPSNSDARICTMKSLTLFSMSSAVTAGSWRLKKDALSILFSTVSIFLLEI